MIYAAILAGGKGERMGNGLPKQFMEVCGKPVLYYSVRRFCAVQEVDRIIVSCHPDHINRAARIVESLQATGRIAVIEGGRTRHESFTNIIGHIRNRGAASGDKVLLHEAARPLVHEDLIREHIENLAHYDATNTLFAAVDVMMVSCNGMFIEGVFSKKDIYHGQGPQGYDLTTLLHVLDHEISASDLRSELDLCALYVRSRRTVKIVQGSEKLFKITYPNDLGLLEYYLRKDTPS